MSIDDYNTAIEDAAHVLSKDLPIRNVVEPWLGLHDSVMVEHYAKCILALRKPKSKQPETALRPAEETKP